MDFEIEPPPGHLLRRIREAAGVTQQQLAERAGTTQAVISRFEVGLRTPTLLLLGRLLHCLELQLTLGAAPLWAKIDAELDAEADRSVEELFTIAAEHRLGEGFILSRIEDTLADFA